MAAATPVMIGWAWTCKYRYSSSDFQRPIILMRSPVTPAHKRAIAPPARVERAETSEDQYEGSG